MTETERRDKFLADHIGKADSATCGDHTLILRYGSLVARDEARRFVERHVIPHRCLDRDGEIRVNDFGDPIAADVTTCGHCGNSWCERCDPTPSPLCHTCHGRGFSHAELASAIPN